MYDEFVSVGDACFNPSATAALDQFKGFKRQYLQKMQIRYRHSLQVITMNCPHF
jgi:hypothetical protein